MKIASLDYVKKEFPLIGEAFESVANAFDTAMQKLSVNLQGSTGTPAPHSSLNVTTQNGITHVSFSNGNNPRTRNLENFVEYSTDPAFGEQSDTQTLHVGVGTHARIPTFMGTTPIYVRTYPQYRDGARGPITYFGGQQNPTPILDGTPSFITLNSGGTLPTDTSTTALTGPALPKTTGSGTSSVPGYGFGKEAYVPNPANPSQPPKVF